MNTLHELDAIALDDALAASILPHMPVRCTADRTSQSTSPSAMATNSDPIRITSLPHELLVPIFDLLPHPADLAPCLPTCKSLYHPALHSLYSRPIRVLTVPRLRRFVSQLAISAASSLGAGAHSGSLVRRLELVLELQRLTDGQLAQLGAVCPSLTHLTIHDAVCIRSNASASESEDDVSEYEFDDGDLNVSETNSSGPDLTRHFASLFARLLKLESLSLKQVKSIDIPHLLAILASSCPHLHTLDISELNHAAHGWRYDDSPAAIRIVQSLSTLPSLRTLTLNDVTSSTMSALLVQHLACPSLTSLSLCNNYLRSTAHYEAAFAGLLARHPALVKLTVLDSKCDNDNIADEIVRAALQVWSGEQPWTGRRVLEVGYYSCSRESRDKVQRVFGGRVILL